MEQNLEPFIGRQVELQTLRGFTHKKTASLIVIRGRRRIGKSRLIQEFAKGCTFYSFAGLFPTKDTTAQSEREEFVRQLNREMGLPEIKVNDWGTLFYFLSEKIKTGKIILLFDEISWMGSQDPDFLAQIKNAWDLQFKQNPQLIFIICGSASSWIEKNILSSTGFVGRISYTLTLEELPLSDCHAFWHNRAHHISAYEKFKILAITGGVPKYLEEINPALPAEDNIKNLCFKRGAYFVDEFERIFSNVFLHKSHLYKKIVTTLINGPKSTDEICQTLKMETSGRMSDYLHELQLSGYVKRDYTWHLQDGMDAKLSQYRLSDNYLRFYLKHIDKYKTKIDRNAFIIPSITTLPGWYSILGLQFENLVLNNRPFLHKMIGIAPEDILSENPFFQRSTSKQPGCQIDYMIQTRFNTLYICEIKFSKTIISTSVIEAVEEKIKRLVRPRGFSCRPVLIHVNGVSEEVIERCYFSNIIDFSSFFK